MSYGNDSGNWRNDAWRNDGGVPPHAFDPLMQPDLFRGVLTRRVFAFLIDLVVLSVPVILAVLFIAPRRLAWWWCVLRSAKQDYASRQGSERRANSARE